MTDTRQHQMPIRHALDAADQAILIAQKAEYKLQAAMAQMEPQAIQAAQAALLQARQEVKDAESQLSSYDDEHYGQQIKQTLQQLHQASQDIEANQEKFHTPKQIR